MHNDTNSWIGDTPTDEEMPADWNSSEPRLCDLVGSKTRAQHLTLELNPQSSRRGRNTISTRPIVGGRTTVTRTHPTSTTGASNHVRARCPGSP